MIREVILKNDEIETSKELYDSFILHLVNDFLEENKTKKKEELDE